MTEYLTNDQVNEIIDGFTVPPGQSEEFDRGAQWAYGQVRRRLNAMREQIAGTQKYPLLQDSNLNLYPYGTLTCWPESMSVPPGWLVIGPVPTSSWAVPVPERALYYIMRDYPHTPEYEEERHLAYESARQVVQQPIIRRNREHP